MQQDAFPHRYHKSPALRHSVSQARCQRPLRASFIITADKSKMLIREGKVQLQAVCGWLWERGSDACVDSGHAKLVL